MAARKSRRRNRRRWRIPGLLAVLTVALLLWFAPQLLVLSGYGHQLVRTFTQDTFPGQLTLGKISLGWLQPVEVRHVRVDDEQGNRLLDVAAIRGDTPLWRLLVDPSNLGRWTVHKPHARVVVEPGTSDVERLLERMPAGGETASGTVPTVVVEVVEGRVDVVGRQAETTLQVAPLEGQLKLGDDSPTALHAEFRAGVLSTENPTTAGHLEIAAALPRALEIGPDRFSGDLAVSCRDVDLAVLDPLFERLELRVRTRGRMSGQARVDTSRGPAVPTLRLSQLAGHRITVLAPDYLGSEPLVLPRLRGQGVAHLDAQSLRLEGVAVDGDVATLEAEGELALHALTRASSDLSALETLSAQPGRVVLGVDLARAAEAMPGLLHVRQDTRIESGMVRLELTSRPDGAQVRWDAHLTTSDLSAIRGDNRLTWPQPVEVALTAHRAPDGLTIDQLRCDGRFVTLEGRGSIDEGAFTGKADLNQLKAALDQFLDLREISLQGQLQAAVEWRRDAERLFQLDGGMRAEEFAVSAGEGSAWREPLLELTLAASGRAGEDWRPESLEQVELRLVAGEDQCTVALVEPVTDLRRTAGTFRGTLRGNLASWRARLRPLAPLEEYDVDGRFAVDWEAAAQPDNVKILSAQMTAENLRVRGGGLYVDEPRLEASASGVLRVPSRELTLADVTLATSALGLRAGEVTASFAAGKSRASADVQVQGDLRRMLAWVSDPAVAPTTQVSGQLSGQATLEQAGDALRVDGDVVVSELAVSQLAASGDAVSAPLASGDILVARTAYRSASGSAGWRTVWSEPTLEVRGGVALEQGGTPRLRLDDIQAVSRHSGVSCRLGGTVSDLARTRVVDVEGELDYDLATAAHRLRELLGPSLQISGREQRAFFLRGPLQSLAVAESASREPSADGAALPPNLVNTAASPPLIPPELQGEAGLGWEAVRYLGIDVGPGQLLAQLQGGVIQAAPLDLAVSQGRLRLEPQVDLNRTPALLSLKPGNLVQEMQITPEMFRGWMRYIAPLLADSTQAEGKFSVDLEQALLPLGQPERATTVGSVTVHAARVGPGPLAQQLLLVVDQVRAIVSPGNAGSRLSGSATWIAMPAQTIEIQLLDGRVHHRGLQLVVDDVAIWTEGSVGLDETIQIDARVPVRDEWLARQPWLAGLQGQSLRIPIRGTLSQPRMDARGLRDMSRKALRQAAGQLIERELGRGLQQLFGPLAQPPTAPPATQPAPPATQPAPPATQPAPPATQPALPEKQPNPLDLQPTTSDP